MCCLDFYVQFISKTNILIRYGERGALGLLTDVGNTFHPVTELTHRRGGSMCPHSESTGSVFIRFFSPVKSRLSYEEALCHVLHLTPEAPSAPSNPVQVCGDHTWSCPLCSGPPLCPWHVPYRTTILVSSCVLLVLCCLDRLSHHTL